MKLTMMLERRGEKIVVEKEITVEESEKMGCDHDGCIDDKGRCWDCGQPRRGSNPPMNWAYPA
jgi:hypothetical protein